MRLAPRAWWFIQPLPNVNHGETKLPLLWVIPLITFQLYCKDCINSMVQQHHWTECSICYTSYTSKHPAYTACGKPKRSFCKHELIVNKATCFARTAGKDPMMLIERRMTGICLVRTARLRRRFWRKNQSFITQLSQTARSQEPLPRQMSLNSPSIAKMTSVFCRQCPGQLKAVSKGTSPTEARNPTQLTLKFPWPMLLAWWIL